MAMSLWRRDPVWVRHALHHVYAATAIPLMITGVFLTLPDLRARFIGGYGREILDLHLWAGWLFLAVPPIALLLGRSPVRSAGSSTQCTSNRIFREGCCERAGANPPRALGVRMGRPIFLSFFFLFRFFFSFRVP